MKSQNQRNHHEAKQVKKLLTSLQKVLQFETDQTLQLYISCKVVHLPAESYAKIYISSNKFDRDKFKMNELQRSIFEMKFTIHNQR